MDFLISILPFLITILVLFIILKLVSMPFKVIIRFLLNSVLGGLAILVINYIGASYGFGIGLNIFTSVFVGITGMPGVLILFLLNYFI